MATNYTRRITLYINDKEVKNDIQTIQKEFFKANTELKKMELGSEEYMKQIQKVKGLKSILEDHTQALKKTVDSTEKVVDNGKKTGGFFGKLKGSLTDLPGPAGQVVSAVAGVSKALWALVANPIGAVIAAVVASVVLLYKAFKSTDSGATKLEGVFKGLSNVMDILLDRVVSYYKMLLSVVTLDFKGVKKNAQDAFGGLADSVKDAALAGYNYAQTMDDIEDREISAAGRMAKLRVEIENLKNATKDKTLADKERMEAAQAAMNKEVELNALESKFLKEKTDAEARNLASKIQNSKLTMEQKEAQLKQWLLVDDLQLQSALENDAAFADFYDKNSAAFQDLQKKKADEIMKEAELAKNTRRLQSELSGFKKELADEDSKQAEERFKNDLERLKKKQQIELLEVKKSMADRGKSIAEINSVIELKEIEHLTALNEFHQQHGKDTTEIEGQIVDKQLKIKEEYTQNIESINSDIEELEKQHIADMAALDEEVLNQNNPESDKKVKILEDNLKRFQELKKKYQDSEITEKEELNAKLKELEEAYLAGGILTFEEYEKKKREITGKTFESMVGKATSYFEAASQLTTTFSNMFAAQKAAELAQAGDNEEKKAQINKKYRKREQAVASAQAGIEGALAIMKIWSGTITGNPVIDAVIKGVMTAAMVATTAAQIKEINSKQFRSGGYTSTSTSDSTPVGVVHANEWVASAPLLRNPETRRHIDYLENVQRGIAPRFNTEAIAQASRGFAAGGFTNQAIQPKTINQPIQTDPIVLKMLQQNSTLMNKLITDGVNTPPINANEVFSKKEKYNQAVNSNEY